ncbi:hypothetical protein NBRC116592_25990 [Colwellia sp. KU-HH00111]
MDITKSLVLCMLLLVNISFVCAQQETKAQSMTSAVQKSSTKDKIDYHQSDNITNQIPYFDNRFRIDAALDQITLIFFRKRGSKPVILVQPDGKKLRINDHDRDKVQWYDDRTYDMVVIKKPMVGPWQAIGNILPESKILIVSDINLVVEPLPEIILSGETLKVIAKLYNGKNKIDMPYFRKVIVLDVNFFSTNNSDYDNFGADAFKIASFRDDGRDLDEYAGDNIYTGEFLLNFAAGEWQPVYVIKLPMMTRELHQKPIILQRTPISFSEKISKNDSNPHRLMIHIDETHIDPKSVVFQGEVTFPDKQIETFAIMDDEYGENQALRIQDIAFTEPGIHRINLKAFGKTITGREFRLVVPEYTFNVEDNSKKRLLSTLGEDGVEQLIEVDEAKLLAEQAEQLAKAKAEQQRMVEEEEMQSIIMIVAGNAIIIIIALISFLVIRRRQKQPQVSDDE